MLETTKLKVNFNIFYFLGFCNYFIGFLFSSINTQYCWRDTVVFCLNLVFVRHCYRKKKKKKDLYYLMLISNFVILKFVLVPNLVTYLTNLFVKLSLLCFDYLLSSSLLSSMRIKYVTSKLNWYLLKISLEIIVSWNIAASARNQYCSFTMI